MAEAFQVIFNQTGAGDATAGYRWENKAPTNTAFSNGPVNIARIVEVTAESAQEACNAVRKAYGESFVTGAMQVAKASSVETKTAI